MWYARYATERSVNPQVSVRGEVYLNRITLFGESAQVSTRQRPNYEMDGRSRRAEETVYGRHPGGAGVEVIRRGQRPP